MASYIICNLLFIILLSTDHYTIACNSGKDYGEFRNFVSVAQLKPSSGRDVSNLFNGEVASKSNSSATSSSSDGHKKSSGGFDDVVQRRKDAIPNNASIKTQIDKKLDKNLHSLLLPLSSTEHSKGNTSKDIQSTKSSRAAHDFQREWKKNCTSAKTTLAFLTRIREDNNTNDNREMILQPHVICRGYFSTDIDSEMVGDIIEALHLLLPSAGGTEDNTDMCSKAKSTMANSFSSQSNAIAFICRWLDALTSCGRFELSVSFLMPYEQVKLKEICNYVLEATSNEKESFLPQLDFMSRYRAVLK